MGSGGTWVPQCMARGDAERVAAGLGADPGRAPAALEEVQLFGTVSALESWQRPGWQAQGALPDREGYPMGACCPVQLSPLQTRALFPAADTMS